MATMRSDAGPVLFRILIGFWKTLVLKKLPWCDADLNFIDDIERVGVSIICKVNLN